MFDIIENCCFYEENSYQLHDLCTEFLISYNLDCILNINCCGILRYEIPCV